VNFATADGTATDGVGERKADYVAESGTLVFEPGDVSQTIKIAIVRDRRDESGETFFVNLSDPANATIEDGQALVKIRDDDRRPRIRIWNAREDEPRSGTGLMHFHVELSNPSGRTVTAGFRTVDLSAVAGRDYVAKTGTLTFGPGETSKSIAIAILADNKKEYDEAFAVKLLDLVNAASGDTVGIGVIEKRRHR
jgi:Calx-beta domain